MSWLHSTEMRSYIGSVGYIVFVFISLAVLVLFEIHETNAEVVYFIAGMLFSPAGEVVKTLIGIDESKKAIEAERKRAEGFDLEARLANQKLKIETAARHHAHDTLVQFFNILAKDLSDVRARYDLQITKKNDHE